MGATGVVLVVHASYSGPRLAQASNLEQPASPEALGMKVYVVRSTLARPELEALIPGNKSQIEGRPLKKTFP